MHNVMRIEEEIEPTREKLFGNSIENIICTNKKKQVRYYHCRVCMMHNLCTSSRLQLLPKWRFHPICAWVHVTRKERKGKDTIRLTRSFGNGEIE